MNSINLNPANAPAAGLPTAHTQTNDSPELDALGNEFTNLMNSAAPAPAAAASVPSSALQSKLDKFGDALNDVINPSNDPVKNVKNMIEFRSQFHEMQNDPEFKQRMADNPDRAADVSSAAARLFAPEGLRNRPLAIQFAISWNALLKGEPKLSDNPELLNQINEAMNRIENNPGDSSAVMDLQILISQLNSKDSGAPSPTAAATR
jgi:hypothetical protein